MSKRLIKVAKELNVGTATIVEHLRKSGFEIENRPTAQVTDDMYVELQKEFQKSIAIKEKADQLIIGNRPASAPDARKDSKATPLFKEEEGKGKEKAAQEPPRKESQETPPPKEKKEEVQEAEKPKLQLKIKGKIDLEKPPAKKKPEKEPEEEPEEEKEAAPTPANGQDTPEEPEKPKKEKAKPEKTEETPVAESAPSDKEPPASEESGETETEGEETEDSDTFRAKTPQLKGLKILGKIDADKLKKTKKKKKEDKKKATAKSDSSEGTRDKSAEDGRKRRKRRRKTVPKSSLRGGGRSGRGDRSSRKKKDDVQEVSQKEIEEKIKATMARLSGGGKKKRQRLRRETRERLREKQEMKQAEVESGALQLTEFVTVQELANLMDVPATDVITTCMNLGVIVSINQRLDAEIIELVAEEFGHEVEFISAEEQVVGEEEEIIDDPEDLEPRAPIVTVMGHVDHGKTSLLDYIRKANVVEGEAGGITQHIGAYEVRVGEENKKITFLDTPGHEAFTAMRARGAKVTDVAVIIIAADDKVMPQTKEAISHAQAAGVPIVFAINKIDKPGADTERIKQELAGMNLMVESWGGKYQSQDISAKNGLNVDALLEKILLEAELLELKANPDRMAIGTVLEASLDRGRGYVAKMLVQTGTLGIGDPIVAGEYSGKIKAMFNERGKRVKEAGPSSPILVLGLGGAPQAGEKFKETESEPEARQIASKRAQINREQANRASKRISLDEIGRRLALGTFKELNLIVKGDVDGSIEALSDSLIQLSQETVQVNVIHKAVGQIIESDVLLASASDAIIIGFQVRPSISARKLAEREGVQIKAYSVIYEAIEEVKSAIEGMLEPTREEKIVAQLEVRDVFKISRVGTVAGCYVAEGKITRNTNVRVIRNGIVIYPTKEGVVGEISSLKRFKDDVKEVKSGLECGVTIKNYNDLKVGDVIEGYQIIEIKQKLNL